MKLKLSLITALSVFAFSLNACHKTSDTTLSYQYEIGALQWQVVRKEIDPNTLIHKAILENAPEVITFLLAHGVNVDYPDENGMTPLTMAILNKSTDTVGLLLSHGANPHPTTRWNNMSLLELAFNMKDPIAAKLLVKHGADVNVIIKNKYGDHTALLQAMEFRRRQNDQQWTDVALLMIDKGADIHYSNNYESPLMKALCVAHTTRDMTMLELLLKKGADINEVQKSGGKEQSTPLILAVHLENLSLVKFLVESGASINKSINRQGVEHATPLNQAIGKIEIVQYLLQHGARG